MTRLLSFQSFEHGEEFISRPSRPDTIFGFLARTGQVTTAFLDDSGEGLRIVNPTMSRWRRCSRWRWQRKPWSYRALCAVVPLPYLRPSAAPRPAPPVRRIAGCATVPAVLRNLQTKHIKSVAPFSLWFLQDAAPDFGDGQRHRFVYSSNRAAISAARLDHLLDNVSVEKVACHRSTLHPSSLERRRSRSAPTRGERPSPARMPPAFGTPPATACWPCDEAVRPSISEQARIRSRSPRALESRNRQCRA
jgi:hypothetical protein